MPPQIPPNHNRRLVFPKFHLNPNQDSDYGRRHLWISFLTWTVPTVYPDLCSDNHLSAQEPQVNLHCHLLAQYQLLHDSRHQSD
jgi:hypothetical protein